MPTETERKTARQRALKMLAKAGIAVGARERAKIEVAELGLGMLEKIGVQLLVYVNTDRYCAKEIILFPRQTCPEHRHPQVGNAPGKQETFRCRWGEVYLYVEGKKTRSIRAGIPRARAMYFTVRHEVRLRPGEQFTVPPDTLHWFQAGDKGAVVSEFSSSSRDEFDVFTDPDIRRMAR